MSAARGDVFAIGLPLSDNSSRYVKLAREVTSWIRLSLRSNFSRANSESRASEETSLIWLSERRNVDNPVRVASGLMSPI